MSQKELLQSLLNKKLGVPLINIETKTNEQMRVLAYTSKHYLYLNQSIDRLKKGYQDYCESKHKEKSKQKKTAKEKPIKRPSNLTRSKTEMSIYNPKKELQSIASSDNYLRRHFTSSTFKKTNNQMSKSMNVKSFSSTFKKGYKVSKVKETPISQSTRLKKRNNTDSNSNSNSNSNRKSSNVKGSSERSGTLTSFYPKQQRKAQCEILNEEFLIENADKAIAKEHETTFMTKRLKPPEEYKEELITIQQQIIKVSNSIVNTEKAMEFKRSSLFSPFITDKANECYFNSNSDKKWLLNILGYLPLKDKLNLYSTSKTFKKLLTKKLTQLKGRIENALNITNSNLSSINEQILGLSKKYKSEINEPYPEFQITRGSHKAIELLNDEMYSKIYFDIDLEPHHRELIVVYRIYHQLIKNEDLVMIQDDALFWSKSCKYFQMHGKDKLGVFISESIKSFCFDDRNVLRLKLLVEDVKLKIMPAYYSKICGGTGLLVFLLKDALEYCGVLYAEKKTAVNRIYHNLLYEKKVIEHLNKYCNSM